MLSCGIPIELFSLLVIISAAVFMALGIITELSDAGTTVTLKSKLSFVVHPPNKNAAMTIATIIRYVFIIISFKLKISFASPGKEVIKIGNRI